MVRPRHSIIFKGKRLPVTNITYVQRHSVRTPRFKSKDFLGTPLTKNGKVLAKLHGENLPPNLKLTVYNSPKRRTRDTARLARKGFLERGGEVGRSAKGYNVRSRLVLLSELILKPAEVRKVYNKMNQSANGIIRLWVEGKLPKGSTISAKDIAENVIKQRVGLTVKAGKKGIKGRQLLNVTHDYVVVAVFQRLTGKKFFQMFKKAPSPNQKLTLYHTQTGRTILEYNKQRFDVTSELQKILNK